MTIEIKEEPKDLIYPRLMQSDGLIVAMLEEGTALILYGNSEYDPMTVEGGFKMSLFKDFKGEVKLKN